MAPHLSIPTFNVARTRSYILRLPLFTRLIVVIILALWVVGLQSAWDLRAWGSLIPKETGLQTMYRTNTFALIHAGVFHMLMNVISLVPLLERFEAENGTLTSLLLFFGPLSTIPALMYVILERGVLRGNTAVLGASVWVFLLLGAESIKTHKNSPHFPIGTAKIPTWSVPVIMAVFISIMVPNTSLLGHLCGLAIGYAWGLGYIKFLAPPEKILRWIESKMNLLGRLPHYVSVDQKTYGRFGVLPTVSGQPGDSRAQGYEGSSQRLG